jgi:hypothetical protein
MNKNIMNQLEFAVKNNYNVLLIGDAGVGKTAVIKQVFESMNFSYMYFSAATMDPWVDFVGVPKEVEDADGNKYLDLIRPKQFAFDTVDAIFMDEYNRAAPKVRNSTMELIQFKSINGKKYNRLKMVWAAINPYSEDDNKYNVEELDPAQLDRFDFHIEIPYKINMEYFTLKYPTIARPSAEWWNALPAEQKKIVSPRRLDKALQTFTEGGDLSWVIPKGVNVSQLAISLKYGCYQDRLKEVFESKNEADIKKLVNDKNTLSDFVKHIVKNKDYCNFFLPFVSDERLSSLLEHEQIIDYLMQPEVVIMRKNLIRSIVNTKSVKSNILDKFTSLLAR